MVPTLPSSAEPLVPSAPPSVLTLAGWLSCWGDAGAAVEEAGGGAPQSVPLFREVKEGEKVGAGFFSQSAWLGKKH